MPILLSTTVLDIEVISRYQHAFNYSSEDFHMIIESDSGTEKLQETKEFIKTLVVDVDVSMLGQFGVGFYYAYLVAEKVIITMKHNVDKQYVWKFQVNGSFTIIKDTFEDKKTNKEFERLSWNHRLKLMKDDTNSIIKILTNCYFDERSVMQTNKHITEADDCPFI
ncbi:hypothetical protein V6N13_065484 [Hibiscus sabdariffa]